MDTGHRNKAACCVITPMAAEDIAPLQRLYTAPSCRRYLGGPVAEEEAERRTRLLLHTGNDSPVWAIRERPGAVAMGIVTLGKHHDGVDTELSFMLLPAFQGKGYATRACALALSHAFETLCRPRVVAETQARNRRSIQLLERLGMSLIRHVTRFEEDQCIYGIDAERWEVQN